MNKMLLYKVVLVIVFFAVTLNGERRQNVNSTPYKIPEPEIEAYKSRGFSVSIDDEPGIRLFAFHGSVNKEVRDLSAGDFSTDILHTKNGKWTYENRGTQLRVGDVIYYWLFVIKDDLGYRLDDGWFAVTELVDPPVDWSSPTRRPRPRPTSRPKPSDQAATLPDTSCNTISQQASTATESPDKDRESFLRVCEFALFNATQAFLSLQSQIDTLRKSNDVLNNLLERYPDSKELTLSGRLPPDEGSAISTVRFIMRGKLDINPDIVSAVRNRDDSITFKVAKFSEKLEILEAAKDKLKTSTILIT